MSHTSAFYKYGRKTVCVLGSHAGENAGGAAMLDGLIDDLRERFAGLRFTVPTHDTTAIELHYAGLDVTPVPTRSWRGCAEWLGWPVWKAIQEADVVLVSDLLFSDRVFKKPMNKYLSSLALLLPLARRRGIPVVLYNVSLAGVDLTMSRWNLKRILTAANQVILRDDMSRRILAKLGPASIPMEEGADPALGVGTVEEAEIDGLLATRGQRADRRVTIGLNVAAPDTRSRSMSPQRLISKLAAAVGWVRGELGADVWLFATHQSDESFCRRLQLACGEEDVALFAYPDVDHRALRGLMSRLSLMVGMRSRALVMATAAGVPVVGLTSEPDATAYLERIGQEHRALPLSELTANKLVRSIDQAWGNRGSLAVEVATAADRQRRRARQAASHLAPYLEFAGLRPERPDTLLWPAAVGEL